MGSRSVAVGMGFKPVGHFRETPDPMERFPGAGQFMVFPVKQAHAGRDAAVNEGTVHLDALFERAAVIFIGMDEQSRCAYMGGIFQRGMCPKLLRGFIQRSCILI